MVTKQAAALNEDCGLGQWLKKWPDNVYIAECVRVMHKHSFPCSMHFSRKDHNCKFWIER